MIPVKEYAELLQLAEQTLSRRDAIYYINEATRLRRMMNVKEEKRARWEVPSVRSARTRRACVAL